VAGRIRRVYQENEMTIAVRAVRGGMLFGLLLSLHQVGWTGDDPIVVFSRVYATPGREAELEARLVKQVAFVKEAEPNVTYRFYRSVKDPTLILTYEVFPDKATVANHMKVVLPAFRAAAGAAPDGLLAKPPESEVVQGFAQ
jgi:quinol monooxygenase YgiN